MKRVISLFITVIMIAGVIFVPSIASLASIVYATAEVSTGDLVTFGSYPQSVVRDEAILAALNGMTLSWVSYEYYSGNGDYGSGKPSDYMKYADITYDGVKYRAVSFTSYRPNWTNSNCSSDNSDQDDNGYHNDTVYWFKYEPIVWCVLDPDPSKALLMTEQLLDSQPFENDYYNERNDKYYGDANHEYYASDWAYSSLRDWLNVDFHDTAFTSSAEKNCIRKTPLTTPLIGSAVQQNEMTVDKVFILSSDDVLNESYGFSSSIYSDEQNKRVAFGTDYAKCQGLWVDDSIRAYSSGVSYWLLRTPCDSDGICYVAGSGDVNNGNYNYHDTGDTYFGVRVALTIDFQSAVDQSLLKKAKLFDPGDVNGDGDVLANDARLALRASAQLEALDEVQKKAADVDGNGDVLANDARLILRFSAQLEKVFPVSLQ